MAYRNTFFWISLTTSIVSLLSSFIWIKGYDGILFKHNKSNLPRIEAKASTTQKNRGSFYVRFNGRMLITAFPSASWLLCDIIFHEFLPSLGEDTLVHYVNIREALFSFSICSTYILYSY
jgi:hypothetical protein